MSFPALKFIFLLHGKIFPCNKNARGTSPCNKKLLFKARKVIVAKASKMLDLLELVSLLYSRIEWPTHLVGQQLFSSPFFLHRNIFPWSKKLIFKAGKQILAKVSKMLDLLELVSLLYSRISCSRNCGAAPRSGTPVIVEFDQFGEYEGPSCSGFPRASQRGKARKLIVANPIFWMFLLELASQLWTSFFCCAGRSSRAAKMRGEHLRAAKNWFSKLGK